MGEKRYSVQSGYVVDLVTGNLLNCHDTRNLLNSQSAEIAGLMETVEAFKWLWSRYEQLDELIKYTESRISEFKPESKAKAEMVLPILKGVLEKRRLKALGVEVPDAAQGG